jgi:hypothetical protein
MALADGETLARMGRAAHMRWAREREAEGRTLRAMYRTLVRG